MAFATGYSTAGTPIQAITRWGRSVARAYLSSQVLGTTNADVIDCAGMVLSGCYVSSNASAGCRYRVYGGLDSTSVAQIQTSTGGLVTIGSTLSTAVVGQAFSLDPALFSAFRYIQFVSETTGYLAPNSSGDAGGQPYINAYLTPQLK